MPPARQKILMCAPDFYGVDYVINAWMEDHVGKANHALAQSQWTVLRQALAQHADLEFVPPVQGCPDLVFTANAGMVQGNVAIVSRFRSPERQVEEPYFKAWFKDHGFQLLDWPEDVFFEGAGDALFDRELPVIWAGYGFRSDIEAAPILEKAFNRSVLSLHLVDPRFYHLDTCLCPLPGGYLMYNPSAFDEESQQDIAHYVPIEKRIVVSEEDALQFACNAVDLQGRIFMNDASEDLQNRLLEAGLTVTLTPLSEFLKAGGTAKCLTLKLIET